MSPFASVARALTANSYSPIPIAPGLKAPGAYIGSTWRIMPGWARYCATPATEFQLRMWEQWPDAGVGLAAGRGVIAFDFDHEPMIEPALAVLPAPLVAKRGRKGLTAFYRSTAPEIKSKGFRSADKIGLMDLIAHGKQTVLPPTIHPDTGKPYEWTTARTLLDTTPAELPEITSAHYAALLDVLRSFGWAAEPERPTPTVGDAVNEETEFSEWYRKLNSDALANLSAWVPLLKLRMQRAGDGYRCVAEWRPSYSGKPNSKRELRVSIKPNGIVDFGDGDKGYTPLDLVLAALDIPQSQVDKGARWLGEAIGYDFTPRTLLPRSAPKAVEPADVALAESIRASAVCLDGTPGADLVRAAGVDPSAFDHALGWSPEQSAIVGLLTDASTAEPTGGLLVGDRIVGAPGVVRLSPDDEVVGALHVAGRLDVALAAMAAGMRPMWIAPEFALPVLAGVECLTVIYDDRGTEQARTLMQRWHEQGREVLEARSDDRAAA